MYGREVMTIICGFDFSPSSRAAAEASLALASGRKEPLHIIHAVGEWPVEVFNEDNVPFIELIQSALQRETQHLVAKGVEVRARVARELPEQALTRVAQAESARLLVVGTQGRRGAAGAPVGRTADRLAQSSEVPTLVVRSAEPFRRWVSGERALKVVVGLDFNLISEDAWAWAQSLSAFGPIDLVGAHVYWPPRELSRLGLSGVRSLVDPDPEVERVVASELTGRFPTTGGPARFRIEPSLGRASDQLVSMAQKESADLIIVGSHQRSGIVRLWEGSVSRGVLHGATAAVACVPLSKEHRRSLRPRVRTVVAATDFSPVGNAGLDHALAHVAPGGKVFLIHVLSRQPRRGASEPSDIFSPSQETAAARSAAEEKLRGLLGRGMEEGVTVESVVLEATDVGAAVAQAAERLGADLICLGTHGERGLTRAALGSVSLRVLTKTDRPVLLVRAPRE
jgi:nucleotide-binding universal stress UspA family protein